MIFLKMAFNLLSHFIDGSVTGEDKGGLVNGIGDEKDDENNGK